MRDWVSAKLEQVEALFPPERLARSKARWTRLWRGEASQDRLPFVYAPARLNYYDAIETPEARLRSSLDEFILRGQVDDDFIPAFFPGCRQSTIPTMFGAREVVIENDYTCERLIACPEEIDRLPAPKLDGAAGEWLAMQRYLLEETAGRLPVHVIDMQGPADVCGKLWGYDELFVAAYTDPERYHALMNAVTTAFIMLWRRQQELLGAQFVGTHLFGWDWVPPEAGASLSADSLVMISADFYREFYQPYLQRIAGAFGGLAVHSCGDFSAVVRAVCATPGVKAINAGQMNVAELLAAGADGGCVIIACTDVQAAAGIFTLARQHALRVDLTIGGAWPTAEGNVKPLDQWTTADRAALARTDAVMHAAAHSSA